MKKSTLAIFLACLLLFSSIFASCSGDSDESTANDNNTDNTSSDFGDTSEESSMQEFENIESINDPIIRPNGYPTVCGSFLQPTAFKNYTLEQMESHLQTMYDVGIDTLILQWSFTTEDFAVQDAYFPYSVDAEKSSSYDASGEALVENILKAAEKVGVKVFIGLNDSSEWWNLGVLDRSWIEDQATLGLSGASQLYEKYASLYPDAFYGWYFVFEFYNMVAPDAVINNAAYLLNLYRDGLYEIDHTMPMMLSPFISAEGADPTETGVLWQKVFESADFREGDIFCCQDSVGAGHITIDELDGYYAEIKKAVDREGGLLFWANNEDFTLVTSSTAPLDRFIEQLNITDKYVSSHVTFAYSHYQHPDMQKFGEHEAYKYYYENGTVPECRLTKPSVEFKAEPNGTVILEGVLKNDDKSAQGVNIYKNGSLIKSIDLTGEYGKSELKFGFSDTNLSGSGVAEYAVCGVDYFGNEGEFVFETIRYTVKNGTNVALTKPYTLILPPEDSYADEGGKTLTDGNYGLEVYFDRAWVGFLVSPEIVIDLESKVSGIYSIAVNTLGGGSAAVYAPTGFKISISDNGTDFKEIKSHTFEPDSGSDSSYAVKRILTLDGNVEARYIKIEITTNQSWIFIDEIAVYAE